MRTQAQTAISVMVLLFGAAAGCGEAEFQVEASPTSEPANQQTDRNEPIAQREVIGVEAAPLLNAKHPIANRSAFPEANETFEQPIPAKRLSELDQFAPAIDPADIPAIVPWDQASRYVGHTITVEGRVVSVGQSGDGKVNFLNFHQDWRGKFYMVVFDDLAKTLDQPVEKLFKDKRVRVKGKVEPHRGRPQVRIVSMDQVEFVDE